MSAPPRPNDFGLISDDWGRFDTPGGRTLYVAENPTAAFAEVLAAAARTAGGRDPLAKDAEALGMSLPDFVAALSGQWEDSGFLQPGHVAPQWRADRRMFTLAMPAVNWWVDMEDPATLSAINGDELLAHTLKRLEITRVDRSHILAVNRALTVRIAHWVRQRTLDDGAGPLGITWQSRYGYGRVFAYWMRHVDDGQAVESEPLTGHNDIGDPISKDDAAIRTLATDFGYTVW